MKNNTVNLLYYSIIYTFMVFFIFVPYIKIGSSSFFSGYILLFVPALLLLILESKLLIKHIYSIYVLCFIFIFSILSFTLNGFYRSLRFEDLDTRGIKLTFFNIFVYLSVVYVNQKILRKLDTKNFLALVYYVINANAIICLFIFYSPDFLILFYSIFDVSDTFYSYPIFRPPGLMYDGFSYLSSLLGLGFLIGVVLFFETNIFDSLLNKLKFIFFQTIIFITIVISGRSGLVVCIIGVGVYFIMMSARGIIFNSHIKNKIQVAAMVIILLLVAGYIILIDSAYSWYLEWSFNFILSLLTSGSSKDSSVEELVKNHYFLPDNIFNLFFGKADFNSHPKIRLYQTDVGYVMLIYGFGIFGLLLTLSVLLIILLKTWGYYSRDPALASTLVLFIVSILILNLKDFYFFSPFPHFIIFYLLIVRLFYGNFCANKVRLK